MFETYLSLFELIAPRQTLPSPRSIRSVLLSACGLLQRTIAGRHIRGHHNHGLRRSPLHKGASPTQLILTTHPSISHALHPSIWLVRESRSWSLSHCPRMQAMLLIVDCKYKLLSNNKLDEVDGEHEIDYGDLGAATMGPKGW